MYGQQTKKDAYVKKLDVDPLLKVEAIITEPQDDNIIEDSSNIRKLYDKNENNFPQVYVKIMYYFVMSIQYMFYITYCQFYSIDNDEL